MRRKRVYSSGHGWGARIFRGVKSVTLVFCVAFLLVWYIVEFGNPFLSYPGPPALQKVFSDHIELMKGQYGLTVRGTGLGQENGKVSQVMISYGVERIASVEEAREMCLVAIQSLLELLNESSDLEAELVTTPMTVSKVEVSIGFRACQRDLLHYPEDRRVVDVLQYEDKILFTAYMEGEEFPTTFHREQYEEALQRSMELKAAQ